MISKAYEHFYKNVKSLVLENDFIKLIILPTGGRIVSLENKIKNREFLMQQETREYTFPKYGDTYTDFGPCGFDDMFPTINECFYESFPWKGHVIPDHGELWGLNWSHFIEKNVIHMSVYGVRLPYLFKKSLHFSSDKEITINYEVTNLSQFDMDFLWTAHPMLTAEEGMELSLPDDCKKAISTLNSSNRIGGFGEELDWPFNTDSSGVKHQLNKIRDKSKKICEKYYFKNRLKEGWIKISYPSDNASINFEFPPGKVPYLGMLVDEGFWKGKFYVIPEPCTAAFDSINNSKLFEKSSVIRGNCSYSWFLKISFT